MTPILLAPMHRFFLPPDQCQSRELLLPGQQAHHALHVLRVRCGARVSILDGAGQEFLCEVTSTERDSVRLRAFETHSIARQPFRITLLQALPKGKLIESIIQKATELGAARIVPLRTERVVRDIKPGDTAHHTERWRSIAIEAIKQCGSAWLPRIDEPLTPQEFLSRQEQFDLPLIASLQQDARHARGWFESFQQQHGRPPATVCVWIGPEGDFSLVEIQTIKAAGALPINLGPRVLRTETAAIYCMSILNHELSRDNEPPKAGL